MSLFNDYQTMINSLAEEKRHKDTIGYQNYMQREANRQGGLKAITNTAIGAGLAYAFPIAGLTAGQSALLGGGLGFMGGGNAMALPYMFNRGGTPKPTGGDVGGSGSLNMDVTGGDFSGVTPTLGTEIDDPYLINQKTKMGLWAHNMRRR